MIFGDFPSEQAEGVMLAHTLKQPGFTFKKGRSLSAADLGLLAEAGVNTVSGARLGPDDLDENRAASAIAAMLAGEHLVAKVAHAGRCDLHAQQSGIVVVHRDVIDRLNLVDEAITVGTLSPYAPVRKGQVVATIKIIPFAVRQSRIAACSELVAAGGAAHAAPPLRVAPLVPHKVALIMSASSGTAPGILDKTLAVTRARIEGLGSRLSLELRCRHDSDAVGAALAEALAAGCDLILVSGAAVTKDRGDVVPSAIVALGGEISHFGMPVEPGNMLLLAGIGPVPVINLPGCARSRRTNGLDWLLHRMLAKLPVSGADIMSMGVGGLIRSPLDEGEAATVGRARVGAIVLAAGRSTRMGGVNKLLCKIDGVPLVSRAVDAACASRCTQVMVVTGFEAALVEEALAGHRVSFTHNPNFEQGMSSSLRRGLMALPRDLDAVLVVLGDMPQISADDIDSLLDAHAADAQAIVVPESGGRRGNPVLWPRRYFAEICAISGDVGARALLERHAGKVKSVSISSDAIFADVDTPEALASLEGR